MITYDPNNEMSNEELDKLATKDFQAFLEYLDAKAAYLKQFTKPLGTYHAKRFAAATAAQQGRQMTKEEFFKQFLSKSNRKKSFANSPNIPKVDASDLYGGFSGSFLLHD